ncbi:putative G-type lectin S-receptor-like serine/threonine-protein kinase At1g61610 isoform X2 [Hibiscus syriacus]|uniref:putative G-type lectin S-receptor-like serine/threonine-protein kinase At1g61610 isoform X2 n=1 Tax=Hibiscus syriacus TaxID=106335 RepID=UPI001923F4D2|nr:putative G-type lectin S-receptor-like serine/threonine-protein kinase At1g61610 isoform X2 [Hibiscus syriacus]
METCNKNPVFVSLVSLIFLLYSFAQFCHAANDKIRQGEALRDGETLVSENNVFELGFFSPGNSSFRYLGIWYEFDSEAVVWVANRDKPILGRNGVLRIEDDGKLVVHDRNDGVVWSSNVSRSSNNTAAKLSNDGNFMLSGDDGGSTLWESFNEPTDTFLPGMRVPVSCKRGECRHFRSWKSPGDPSPGNYSLCVDPNGGQQIVLWDNNNQRRWRSGQWNLQFFTGLPFMRDKANYLHGFDISRPDENGTMYITYTPLKHPKPSLFRFQISWEGWEKQSRWNASEKKWDYLHTEPDPDNQCELYNLCGNYSTCDRSRKCICLKGFRPKSQAQWDASNWSGGCVHPGRKISNLMIVIISLVLAGCLAASLWLLCRYKKKLKVSSRPCCMDDDVAVSDVSKIKSKEFSTDFFVPTDILIDGSQVNGPELQNFDFSYIATATKNFCDENRLGQGGFGTVYKGELPSGEQIAVKRLSVQSGQGLEEFKTEIILIAKLQHRNLVRLLGCCIHGDEKLLIYEYMPNKSLDRLLFDEAKKAELDWRTRLGIIEGIARGLLYLHRDSRHRIIHRDLKASNILLDAEMNPKISDFGMARMFGGNQNEAKTVRVVGTYGYMSPEYAMEGLFSVKSDAYSFGVLLLEIVSGQRNNSFRSFDHTSLLTYAWQLWSEDKIMDLVDPCIRDSCSPNEVLKCIHPAMLCVQDSPARRPKMETVVVFLESETATLPMPTKPTYTSLRTAVEEENVLDGQQVSSNHVTVTTIVGR